MTLPELTHRQVAVLDRIWTGGEEGVAAIDLVAAGTFGKGPQCYQTMERLRRAGLVEAFRCGRDRGRTRYRITELGRQAVNDTIGWYCETFNLIQEDERRG